MKINYMLSKTTEFLSVPLIVNEAEGFSLFRLLFQIVSGLFQSVARVDDTKYFDLQIYSSSFDFQLCRDFITKWGQGYKKCAILDAEVTLSKS